MWKRWERRPWQENAGRPTHKTEESDQMSEALIKPSNHMYLLSLVYLYQTFQEEIQTLHLHEELNHHEGHEGWL